MVVTAAFRELTAARVIIRGWSVMPTAAIAVGPIVLTIILSTEEIIETNIISATAGAATLATVFRAGIVLGRSPKRRDSGTNDAGEK